MPITLEIATFAATFNPSAVDDLARERCVLALADTVAVAIAGCEETSVKLAGEYLQTAGELGGGRSAGLWGKAERYMPELAALYNGIAAHALDYDDQCLATKGHPSAVLFPGLLALGESADCPGSRLISAYVVGIEVMSRLGSMLAASQYDRGWHTTATIGVIGCTVACAHLIGLNATKTANAIGIAVVQAGGTQANFGTHAKHFQVGHAAAAAIRSVLLASKGFEACPTAIEHPAGYAALYGGAPNRLDFGGLENPLAVGQKGLELKGFPLCYATHRAITAVLQLRGEHGIRASDVERATVVTHLGGLKPLRRSLPVNGLEGKFSMEYAVAAALLDGRVALGSFIDSAILRAEIQALMSLISVREAEGDSGLTRWAEVEIELRDGKRHVTRIQDLGLEEAKSQLKSSAKVADCLAWGSSPLTGDALLRACLDLEKNSVRDFVAALLP